MTATPRMSLAKVVTPFINGVSNKSAKYLNYLMYSLAWLRVKWARYLLSMHVQQVEKNMYDITYALYWNTYKIRIHKTPGRCPYKQFVNEDTGEDVTTLLLQYVGPDYNFHGLLYTPSMFHINNLRVIYQNDNSVLLAKDDLITIQKYK